VLGPVLIQSGLAGMGARFGLFGARAFAHGYDGGGAGSVEFGYPRRRELEQDVPSVETRSMDGRRRYRAGMDSRICSNHSRYRTVLKEQS